MAKIWRLILDGKHNGYYNMAADEAILFNYSFLKIPTLRVYGWSKPFITLGYSQDPKEVLKPTNEIPFLRRITGGSSILHDKEVTYSLTCALGDLNLPSSVKDSYKILCSFLKNFYQRLGLLARFAQDIEGFSSAEPTPFCFEGWQQFDLVIAGKKIGGNAQRRKRNLIFQQGSIPQKLNFFIIKQAIRVTMNINKRTTSLEELLGHQVKFSFLTTLLSESFKETFNLKLYKDTFLAQERQTIEGILEKKRQICLF